MQTFATISKNNDYFTSEYVINETPIAARNVLTKGFVQDEICQYSGAAISTRGRFMTKNDHSKSPHDRPLYLFIQGPTKQSIEMAMQKIDEIIRGDGSNVIRSNFGRTNDLMQNDNKHPMSQAEKIFIGLDNMPASFDLRNKIIGQGGSNLQYIRSETGAAVSLRGRGSQFVDPQLGHEAPDPMHLLIEHTQPDGLVAARQLAVNLIETLVQEIQQTGPDTQNQNINMPANQMLNPPPRIIGMPPLSVPPPQQFTTVPQQPTQNIEQPMMISNNPPEQMQHIRSQQIQHVQQIPPPQQVLLQQPPPLARAPIVSIPPPGIHIPQHPVPMVPPPQIVQLPAPPPAAVSSGNVLVVAPPPSQSIYIPQELGASSSSVGNFSFFHGGLLYHQAPPIQTQAQIGDGLHIISAPPQNTVDNVSVSMNSHTQPPPHMIITQVQVDSNSQSAGKQISFQQPVSSQHQKTQFVIGHIGQDQTTVQGAQPLENFTHFGGNVQTSAPTSIVFTVPYNITTTVVSASQMQQHSEQENALKQINRQIVQSGLVTIQQRPRNDRPPMAMQIPAGQSQPTMEQVIMAQPPNTQALMNQISHIPPNPMMTQMPPNPMQNNTYIQSQSTAMSNHVMVSQHDLNHLQNQMSHMPPILTNQLPPNSVPMSQMSTVPLIPSSHLAPIMSQDSMTQLQQSAPPQLQRQPTPHRPQFKQMSYDHPPTRHDGQNRMRLNAPVRLRNKQRLNRQNTFPWNKNDPDKYSGPEPNWQKRDADRGFDFDAVSSDDRKSQRSNSDRNQFDNEKKNNPNTSKSQDAPNNWKRSDKSDHQHDDTLDSGRKRKYDSDNPRSGRSDNNQISSNESSNAPHKSRFEPEDTMKLELGCQQKQGAHKMASSKSYGGGDQKKPDNETSSKWMEQSGDSSRCGGNVDNIEETNLPEMSRSAGDQNQIDGHGEKSNDPSLVPCSWSEHTSDVKGNQQYTPAAHYQMSNVNDDRDKQFNPSYQPGFMNPVHMYQNSMSYILPPPPPPPPPAQPAMQFNLPQCSAGSLAQSVPPPIQVVNGAGPSIVSSLPSHILPAVPPAMPNPMSQNVPFDMGQNIIVSQSVPTNVNQNMASPAVIPPNQMLPSSMSQSMMPPAYNVQSMVASVTHAIPMSMSNTMAMTMQQPVMGQMPMSVGPTMVPPPALNGVRPQNASAVPPPPPPPPPTSMHPMPNQSPYPYWMGQ